MLKRDYILLAFIFGCGWSCAGTLKAKYGGLDVVMEVRPVNESTLHCLEYCCIERDVHVCTLDVECVLDGCQVAGAD